MTDRQASFAQCFDATELAARSAQCEIMTRLKNLGLAEEQTGGVEIALAEAVNNVVEHAYAGTATGEVTVQCELNGSRLMMCITDHGTPLPEGQLPEGNPADVNVPMQDLPEGGFGWFMIRALARDIRYLREDGKNHLRLTFDLVPPIV